MPNDIVPRGPAINRPVIAITPGGRLLLTFTAVLRGASRGRLWFSSAPAELAWSSAQWTRPLEVSARGGAYLSDLQLDSAGTLHLVFDDQGDKTGDVCSPGVCADLYYRRSTDGGRTWPSLTNLSSSAAGTGRGRLHIDAAGAFHVTWDEGWDRLTGIGTPEYSVYRYSADGGRTWSDPLFITAPTLGTAQLIASSDGKGGVLLVYRIASLSLVFYRSSADGGQTWTPFGIIPGIYARRWDDTPYDSYDLVVDSAMNHHLVLAGRLSAGERDPVELLHVSWDGTRWSGVDVIYRGPGFPDSPRLGISEGNHLHAVFFVRDELYRQSSGNYEVYYCEAVSSAPRQTPLPTPQPSPSATPRPTATQMPTPTPSPTLPPVASVDVGSRGEEAQLARLGQALVPIAVLLGMSGLAILARRRRVG